MALPPLLCAFLLYVEFCTFQATTNVIGRLPGEDTIAIWNEHS